MIFFADPDNIDNPINRIRLLLRHWINPFEAELNSRDQYPHATSS